MLSRRADADTEHLLPLAAMAWQSAALRWPQAVPGLCRHLTDLLGRAQGRAGGDVAKLQGWGAGIIVACFFSRTQRKEKEKSPTGP